MYAEYFGLRDNPFSITPDPRYLFLSARHREALAHLLFGVGEGGGFVQLSGEVGTGKTTVCRAFLEQLPDHVDVALILNPMLDAVQLLAAVCEELGVELPKGADNAKALVDALSHYLLDAHARGRRTVLLIDEAQNLSAEVLEQVRLLTNLETATHKLLQIFLVGQPELDALLQSPGLRQVAQRITARYHLDALDSGETRDYILHRLAVAGGPADLFTAGALRAIYRASGGVPRLINILCDRALLGAYSQDQRRVAAPVVRRAAAELRGRRAPRPLWRNWVLGGGMLAAVAAAGWSFVPQGTGAGAPSTPEPQIAAALPHDPTPPLSQWLDAAASDAGRKATTAALFRLWGAVPAADPCASQALRCLQVSGTWNNLRRLDRPALLSLRNADGSEVPALVVALQGDRVTLRLGEHLATLPVTDVDRYWLGTFTLLWRAPLAGVDTISAASGPQAVQWLRGALRRVMGADLEVTGGMDEPLRAAVRRFQASRGLNVDGIAGAYTLIHLNSALDAANTPRLQPAPEKG